MGLFDRFARSKSSTSAAGALAAQQPGLSAEQWLEKGSWLEEQGRAEEALSCYESAIYLMPKMAQAHFKRGNILLDRGDAKEALQAYTEAAAYKSDSASVFYNMGMAQQRLGLQEAAVTAYQSSIALRPDFADAELALARALEASGKAGDAITHYRKAFHINPGCADLFFDQGLAFQDADLPEEAEERYRLVLKINPDHFDANNNLGVILIHKGMSEDAAACFRRALNAGPANADIHRNLGVALDSLGQPEDAAANFRAAIAIQPNDAAAHGHLGNVLRKLKHLEAALASYRRSLAIKSDDTDVLFNQGVTLQELGELEEAAACYALLLKLRPELAQAHNNLGAIEKKFSRNDAAAECFKRAIDINPDFAEAHGNLGNALQALGQLDAAEQSYLTALAINPDLAVVRNNYGSIFQARGLLDDAEIHYRRAIEMQPDLHDAHNNLGIVLNQTRRFTESMASFHRALQIKPDFSAAYVNLGNAQKDVGQITEAVESLHSALKLDANNVQAHHNLLFIHNYLNDQPRALMLSQAKRFGEVVDRKARPYTTWSTDPDPERRLRVGFISGDLRNHPVGYFMEGVLEALVSQTPKRLEIFAYQNRIGDDETSRRIRACCSRWHWTVGQSDEALAEQIHRDGIDILIDLSGHTANSRLPVLAWRPAPVQANWLGYFATTGLSAVDYFIADPWTLLEEEEVYFTEQVWRLPETRLCFTAPNVAIDVSPLPALTNGYITFGCFNNPAKINDAVIALWARILLALPGSRLFLKSQRIAEASRRQEIYDRFGAHGIDADQLILEEYGPRAEYLAAYRRVDIALDPFPFPGGTTTTECLWMGVPVLTLAGEQFLSRQGAGLLMNAGLPEWVASTPDEYVARGIAHATDLQSLARLRAGLRKQVLDSPIFDAPRFARHFEDALRGMWRKWCDQTNSR